MQWWTSFSTNTRKPYIDTNWVSIRFCQDEVWHITNIALYMMNSLLYEFCECAIYALVSVIDKYILEVMSFWFEIQKNTQPWIQVRNKATASWEILVSYMISLSNFLLYSDSLAKLYRTCLLRDNMESSSANDKNNRSKKNHQRPLIAFNSTAKLNSLNRCLWISCWTINYIEKLRLFLQLRFVS